MHILLKLNLHVCILKLLLIMAFVSNNVLLNPNLISSVKKPLEIKTLYLQRRYTSEYYIFHVFTYGIFVNK